MIEAFELFHHLDAREIDMHLSSMYHITLNKAKYLNDLQAFSRKNSENILRAMSRLNIILIGIEQFKRPGEKIVDRETQLRHHLRLMAGDKIWVNFPKVNK